MINPPKTIVLLSGGMNSAAMLLGMLKLQTTEVVECMIFDYGQEHAEEIDCARTLCDKFEVPSSLWSFDPGPLMDVGVEHARVPIDVEVGHPYLYSHMLNCAIYRAQVVTESDQIAAGFLKEEMSVSYDALTTFFRGAVWFSNQGDSTSAAIRYTFPMWSKTKAEVFQLVEDIDCTAEVLMDTVSCLRGNAELRHQWGYGCGSCDGCVRRWRAWEAHLHAKG